LLDKASGLVVDALPHLIHAFIVCGVDDGVFEEDGGHLTTN